MNEQVLNNENDLESYFRLRNYLLRARLFPRSFMHYNRKYFFVRALKPFEQIPQLKDRPTLELVAYKHRFAAVLSISHPKTGLPSIAIFLTRRGTYMLETRDYLTLLRILTEKQIEPYIQLMNPISIPVTKTLIRLIQRYVDSQTARRYRLESVISK